MSFKTEHKYTIGCVVYYYSHYHKKVMMGEVMEIKIIEDLTLRYRLYNRLTKETVKNEDELYSSENTACAAHSLENKILNNYPDW